MNRNGTGNGAQLDLAAATRRFWLALLIFLVCALICAAQARARITLEKTREGLLRAQEGLALLRQGSAARSAALTGFRNQYQQAGLSPEQLLYRRLDALKGELAPDDLTLSQLEKKGEQVSLQYSFNFINPPLDRFLNALCLLEGSAFPLTVVHSVSIARAATDGREVLSCTVNGTLLAFPEGRP